VIAFESSQTAEQVQKIVADALEDGAKFVTLGDDKGKIYVVPSVSLSYVEIGSESSRRIGFVA